MQVEGEGKKAQSAMEFMLTYGWAILILIIVVALLFQLGIFNFDQLGPRVLAGECQVYRPYGPFTTQLMALSGVCNGEPPQFVGTFGYSAPLSNVGSANVTVNTVNGMPVMTNGNKQGATFTAWVKSGSPGPTETIFYYGIKPSTPTAPYNGIYLNTNTPGECNLGLVIIQYTSATCVYNAPLPIGKWVFVAVEYDGANSLGYLIINGNIISGIGAATMPYIPANSSLLIAVPWNGTVANFQQYNVPLSQLDIRNLYIEGIGGPPIELPNLVGWWPLNGDTKDYGGNGVNAAPTNTAFTNNWGNGYTPP